MSMYKPPRRPQFFYTTAPLPCPYLAGRTERKVVTEIVGPDAEALHDVPYEVGREACRPDRDAA